MKKIIIPILLIGAASYAQADYRYPFYEHCIDEIPEFCESMANDLTDCLIDNPDDLSDDCVMAVRAYDRERWGWDRDIYDRWHHMGHEEKAEFKMHNRPAMQEREHLRFHGGALQYHH
jgi:hypothetical protein